MTTTCSKQQTMKCWLCGETLTAPTGALPITYWVHFYSKPGEGKKRCVALNYNSNVQKKS